MPQAGAVKAAAAFHGTIPRGEYKDLPLLGGDDFRFRLSPGLLFYDDEFAAFVVRSGLAQKAGQLQRKGDGSVYILVETIEIAAFIMQEQRSGPGLSIIRAGLEKAGMALGKDFG